jgi:hypothetical protein
LIAVDFETERMHDRKANDAKRRTKSLTCEM